jgi:hypothetical protein
VAVIASVAAGNMLHMFAGGAAVVMAQHAIQWRAFEHSANVAAGAVYKLVPAG